MAPKATRLVWSITIALVVAFTACSSDPTRPRPSATAAQVGQPEETAVDTPSTVEMIDSVSSDPNVLHPGPVAAGDAHGAPRPTTLGDEPDASAAIGSIVYADGALDSSSGIFVVNPDGRNARRVSTPGEAMWAPRWSSYGRRIAAASAKGIVVIERDGANRIVASQDLDAATWIDKPAWSPDGRWIAFERHTITCPTWGGCGDRADVYVVEVATSQQRLIAVAPGLEFEPTWSPDGQLLAFTSGSVITVVRPDGSEPRAVSPVSVQAMRPAWAPDSRRIAFAAAVPGADQAFELWTVNADGADARNLGARVVIWNGGPAWSPDGTRLVFESPGLAVVNADGSGYRTLRPEVPCDEARGGPCDIDPSWSPDSNRILFVLDGFRGRAGIWSVNSDGSELVRITSQQAFDPSWSSAP